MAEESVKVAVRVRPFNQREKDRNAKLIIKMKDQTTLITDTNNSNDTKQFTFDYSYWSHDGYLEKEDGYLVPNGANSSYCSQQKVFDDLGKGVLNNAFEGFNCSLFAYGQTGSGKSYSMVGYGVNRGIVPMTCEMLFKTLKNKNNSDEKYEVTFSMLEIYNEQVRDLLSKDNPKGGLQIRQHPSMGSFYAQGLKRVPVGSYSEIEARIEEGTANRTVASTNMNATSSRAHTIASITFDQIFNTGAGETRKSSVINLVDLAGSERADSTGATGDRLKEGANINKSLSVLGNCISALAELSTNPKKKIIVPYRDSVLTKLLQNALGGNSKTVMIAALSPADINFDETLSTLRYADRAKQIKNKAVVNENPIEKLIRELKEENERLKSIIQSGQFTPDTDPNAKLAEPISPKEFEKKKKLIEEDLRAQLQANQEMLQEVNTSWNEKLQKAQKESADEKKDIQVKEERKNNEPYLTNLNEDPMLSYVICHFIGKNTTTIGSSPKNNIQLHGLSIMESHAIIKNENGEIELLAAQAGTKIKINGIDLNGSRILENNDRVLFGSSNMYVFIDPKVKKDSKMVINWEFAQKEIAEVKGFSTKISKLSQEQQVVQEEIIKLLPLISEANAMSEELNKYITFEVLMIPAISTQINSETSQFSNSTQKVVVKVNNLLNQNAGLWDSGKFMNRRYLMLEHYQKYLDGDEHILYIRKEDDPFWEPTEDLFVGTANVFLQSLAYFMDFDDKLKISDFKGQVIGMLNTAIVPCNQQGKAIHDDLFNEDPNSLLSKPYSFKVILRSCELSNSKYPQYLIKYKIFDENEYTQTQKFSNNSDSKSHSNIHTRVVSFSSTTKEHLNYFENGFITFLLYAIQEDNTPDDKYFRMTTKELKQLREREEKKIARKDSVFQYPSGDMDTAHLKSELILLQKKYYRLEAKEKHLQKLCAEWNTKKTDNYQEFYKNVCQIVNSNANFKFKATAEVITKLQLADKVYGVDLYNDDDAAKQDVKTNKNQPIANGDQHMVKNDVQQTSTTPSKTCTIN